MTEDMNQDFNQPVDAEFEEIEDTEEQAEQTEEKENLNVKGGILLFRTEEDGIVYQPYENLGIVDLTVFAEYLNQLKDKEWAARIEGGNIED